MARPAWNGRRTITAWVRLVQSCPAAPVATGAAGQFRRGYSSI
ncbi:hypothetical protein [Komagataeibacter xylinus]|nr:hypothetical protein [Komagataeibacter xylinus]